jgi:hypothetical protein
MGYRASPETSNALNLSYFCVRQRGVERPDIKLYLFACVEIQPEGDIRFASQATFDTNAKPNLSVHLIDHVGGTAP